MARVTLKSVGKIYSGNVRAVKDFNLEIESGEFVVMVGPSGCGKSTTLRMIAGLEEISEGTIQIGERVVNDVPPKDRDIAMVFQNYALYPHMTVYQNMAFGLKLRKFKKAEIEPRVREAAEILGIEELLERRPKALSGGQRQRVAVGRAIVRKPAVFPFDEPLSNLDAKMRVQMRTEISRLHSRLQTTMIYVTHDQVEAMTMGDRIVVMKDGLIQQVATPTELYDNPVNTFVAGFIGTPPMNFFTVTLVDDHGTPTLQEESVAIPVPPEWRQAVAPYHGREVTLGVRPEHIGSPTAEAMPGLPRLKARIEVVEPMGSETYVYLNTGRNAYIARVDSHWQGRVGNTVDMAILLTKGHLFDPASGQVII